MLGNGPRTLGLSRSRVFEELASAGGPLGVAELASRVGLHRNTARFHLDALVHAGLAERAAGRPTRPGRPPVLYSATAQGPAVGQRSYRLLAEILAGHLHAHTRRPAEAAASAGREWGRYVAEPPGPFQPVDASAATRQLLDVLTEAGFAPEAFTAGRRRTIRLHHCPFREIATTRPEVVCSVHLGLAQGLLAAIRAPLQAERIEPFVEPSLCLIHLGARKVSTTVG